MLRMWKQDFSKMLQGLISSIVVQAKFFNHLVTMGLLRVIIIQQATSFAVQQVKTTEVLNSTSISKPNKATRATALWL